MDWISLGTNIRNFILKIADLVTLDYSPGLVSLGLAIVLAILLILMIGVMRQRRGILIKTTNRIRSTGDAAGFQKQLHDIERELHRPIHVRVVVWLRLSWNSAKR